jgi:putative chitinase
VRIDSGPFIGIIKNNVDPARAGRLQVWIPDLSAREDDAKGWKTVSYASPFSGATTQFMKPDNNRFEDVAHSYGMWAVVPDLGNQVICTFIAGDPNKGYWFACVNPNLSHHMVPAVASSSKVDNSLTSVGLQEKFTDESNWPVAEFNQNVQANFSPTWTNNKKPVHEFQANVLINQGLDRDRVRGAISSSSQRESPSQVFGLSTPGRPLQDPADQPDYAEKLAAGTLSVKDLTITARKGGHSLVMDDGDQLGGSQLARLRTSGGHQLLMDDTSKVLYIANSDGSAWIEFSRSGQINMYSAGGISMRTEGDFNVHAGKDINMHSQGSIKLRADAAIISQSRDNFIKASATVGIDAGKINLLSSGSLGLQGTTVNANSSGNMILRGSKLLLNTETPAVVPSVPGIKSFSKADTSWDKVKGLWVTQPDVFESITTVTPSHEPWTRGKAAAVPAPKTEKQSSVCVPPVSAQSNTDTAISTTPLSSGNEGIMEAALRAYGINGPVKLAAIMSQCAHESLNFKILQENLNYSAAGLVTTFSKYFPNVSSAEPFARQPEKIANVVYGGRIGNGPAATGDGWKFRGRGFIQLTGRSNYTTAGSSLGLDLVNNPDLAMSPESAAKIVIYFFFTLNAARTASINWSDVSAVTRLVNGGENGLADRKAKYAAYLTKYSSGVETPTAATNVQTSAQSSMADAGINSATGQAVNNPAPIESMKRQDIPAPGAIPAASSNTPGLLGTQLLALMVQIGYSESQLVYTANDTKLNRIGRYKINALLLRDNGFIKPDYVRQYGASAIYRADAYTGKSGISSYQAYLDSPTVQDTIMESILTGYYSILVQTQAIQVGDDICTVAGMIAVAYFYRDNQVGLTTGNPTSSAKFWRAQSGNPSTQGITGDVPYNQGRYAIDVLSLNK